MGALESNCDDTSNAVQPQPDWPLSTDEYKRYGRQLILPEIGLPGQLLLKSTAVLIVGVGGLGCPAATYLVGAGIGKLGLIDDDFVELSNLHRQVLHSTKRIGLSKVDSAVQNLKELNPFVEFVSYQQRLTSQTVLDIFSSYDVILDCTDHPTSRYMISDAAVILQKILVSASALRTEGQLIVLNHPPLPPGDPSGGPCYRCIFPKPPPPETLVSCGEGGILGPVVGVIGVLQALEAIKIVTNGSFHSANGFNERPPSAPTLLVFSTFDHQPFRHVKMRGRRGDCAVCSKISTITADSLMSGSLDYVEFCGFTHPVNILAPEERVSALEYQKLRKSKETGVLIDVREKPEFGLCSLDGSVNIPFSELIKWTEPPEIQELIGKGAIYVVCRIGNDSQLATRRLKEFGLDEGGTRYIGDIRGGFKAWRECVDSTWPDY